MKEFHDRMATNYRTIHGMPLYLEDSREPIECRNHGMQTGRCGGNPAKYYTSSEQKTGLSDRPPTPTPGFTTSTKNTAKAAPTTPHGSSLTISNSVHYSESTKPSGDDSTYEDELSLASHNVENTAGAIAIGSTLHGPSIMISEPVHFNAIASTTHETPQDDQELTPNPYPSITSSKPVHYTQNTENTKPSGETTTEDNL